VKYPVHEADAGAFIWILVGKLNVDFPKTTREGCLVRALETDIKLLPVGVLVVC
jgi:hypothetical protein